MNIVINKDLQELTKTFESNSKFNVRSLAAHEISNQAIKDSDAVFLRSTTKINEELLAVSYTHLTLPTILSV